MAARSRRRMALVAVAALCMAVPACGRSVSSTQGQSQGSGIVSPTKGLVATTPAGTKAVQSVVWAVYRDVNSLDPIFAFDYPENTADSLMCESLLLQSPGGALKPGLASVSTPSPTTMVFTLRPGAKFWDGHPVAPADVVYSLDRNTDPKLGGFYGPVFSRVSSIAATGSDQVTITLKQPDYWLEGELASMPGIIIEKSFAQQQGKNYGTPAGRIMCTGAYMFKSWNPGVGVVAVANPHYWNSSAKPLVQQITIKGAPDVSAFTSAMLTNGIQGSYSFALPTLDQLKASSSVKVYQGPGWSTDAFIICSFKGALGDVRVRRALSMALNRQGIINFFTDPKARAGIDGFPTVNYGDYADPAALLSTVVLPDGSQNYTGFNDPKITSALDQARSTADPAKRAALVAQAEKLTVQQMPWIPNAQPTSLLVLNKSLTGAVSSFAYMFAPWANQLGGTG
jgi:peptide/nickel transport system substrate-binding protein